MNAANCFGLPFSGTTPTVAGDDIKVIPAGQFRAIGFPDPTNARTLKIVTGTAAAYTAEVF